MNNLWKVTLWRNDEYCSLKNDYEDCAWSVTVKAATKYQAAERALQPYLETKNKNLHHTEYPIIYEVKQIK